jgi:hypothetical protein
VIALQLFSVQSYSFIRGISKGASLEAPFPYSPPVVPGLLTAGRLQPGFLFRFPRRAIGTIAS